MKNQKKIEEQVPKQTPIVQKKQWVKPEMTIMEIYQGTIGGVDVGDLDAS